MINQLVQRKILGNKQKYIVGCAAMKIKTKNTQLYLEIGVTPSISHNGVFAGLGEYY